MIDNTLQKMNAVFDNSIKKRFWNFVPVRQAGSCWNWDGTTYNEYGKFHLNGTSKWAHRVSWIMHYGLIPNGMLICHKCDNKRCVNPNHLYSGTPSDNINDRYKRFPDSGRGRNYSKLTEEEARIVMLLRSEGRSYIQIGKLFNVTGNTISNICRGRTTLFKEDN